MLEEHYYTLIRIKVKDMETLLVEKGILLYFLKLVICPVRLPI